MPGSLSAEVARGARLARLCEPLRVVQIPAGAAVLSDAEPLGCKRPNRPEPLASGLRFLGREQDRANFAVVDAVAHDLAVIVYAIGAGQDPAGITFDEIVEVVQLIAGVKESALDSLRAFGRAHDPVAAIHIVRITRVVA